MGSGFPDGPGRVRASLEGLTVGWQGLAASLGGFRQPEGFAVGWQGLAASLGRIGGGPATDWPPRLEGLTVGPARGLAAEGRGDRPQKREGIDRGSGEA